MPNFCDLSLPKFPPAVPGSVASDPQTARQLWGLAVRGERALRATALLWTAQRAAWGEEAADLLANIAKPTSLLYGGLRQGVVQLSPAATAPLVRLLFSCAATELKAARVAGLQPGPWIFSFMEAAFLRNSSTALSPTAVSLLLPRLASTAPARGSQLCANDAFKLMGIMCEAMGADSLTRTLALTSCHMSALLSRSVAELAILNQAATRQQAGWAVAMLVVYATSIVQLSGATIPLGHGGRVPPETRAKLAQPIMMLLHSPLLGLLASLQHVAISSSASFNSWTFPEGSNVPPVHMMPAHMAPDALDSKLAMQVGYSLFSQGCLCTKLFHPSPGIGGRILALPTPQLTSPYLLQGSYLTITLHTLTAMMNILIMESVGGHDSITGMIVTSVRDHIKVMWEANCSCRAAGYPECDLEELNQTWGDGNTCSGLPSPMDVPTRSQAAARESATEVLHNMQRLAGLVWPDHPAAAASSCSDGIHPASYADWEVLQSELLELPSPSQAEGLPAASSSVPCTWGEALWCFNPTCTNMEGPSELALKTFACGGGCGVRYCSPECQAQGWRDGHRLSCGRLRDRRAVRVGGREQ